MYGQQTGGAYPFEMLFVNFQGCRHSLSILNCTGESELAILYCREILKNSVDRVKLHSLGKAQIFYTSVMKLKRVLKFILNVFLEFTEFSNKNICHYSKRARTSHLLSKRPGCYHSTNKTHIRDRIFKLIPIPASVIYQIC